MTCRGLFARRRGDSGTPAATAPGGDGRAAPHSPEQGAGRTRWPLLAPLVLVGTGLVLFFLPLLALGGQDELLPLDRAARLAGRDLAAAGARAVAEVVTALGAFLTTTIAVLAATIVLLAARRPRPALALAAGFLTVVVAVQLIKAGVGRLRPPGASPSLTTASFPSGHAAYATAYSALAIALIRVRAPAPRIRRLVLAGALGLTVVIGLTRVVLGVHYLSDVVAGWALGAAIFGLAAAAAVTVARMRQTERRV